MSIWGWSVAENSVRLLDIRNNKRNTLHEGRVFFILTLGIVIV